MFDFLKQKDSGTKLTSLKLKQPAIPQFNAARSANAAPTANALSEAIKKTAEAIKDSPAQAEIQRRALELAKSGKHPEMFIFLRQRANHEPLAILMKEPARKAVLIFTSVPLAYFFMQTQASVRDQQRTLEVVGAKLDEFPPIAEDWQKRGIDSYILDLSPKAPVLTAMTPKDNLITREQLVFSWALGRTIRNWQAQNRLAEFYFKKDSNPTAPETLQKHRAALETMRDFGAFDVPFVHWMIAEVAGMQGDEPARLAATATLESFGPDFVGKTTCPEGKQGIKAWADSMMVARIGLLTEFGMLMGPDGLPMQSIMKLETRTPPEVAP
jgi:hypothetical protein